MSTCFSLVCAGLFVGIGAAGAQQAPRPELVTNRSVATDPAPQAAADPARTEWANHAMSKFLDDDASEGEPVR